MRKSGNAKIVVGIIVFLLVIASSIIVLLISKGESSLLTGEGYSNKSGEKFTFNNQEDYIAVQNSDGKYGYIDTKGNEKLEFIYKAATNFINGLAVVENENYEYGIIDINGKAIVNFGTYKLIERINEEEIVQKDSSNMFRAKIDDNKYVLLNSKGNITNNNTYNDISYNKGIVYFDREDTYGILNGSGKEIYTTDMEFKVLDSEDNIVLLKGKKDNAIVINYTKGNVIGESDNKINSYTSIIKENEGYYLIDDSLYDENKMIYKAEENYYITSVNNTGIISINYMYSKDDMASKYYSLNSKKEIYNRNDGETPFLLQDKVVYQDNEQNIYTINADGEKTFVISAENMKLREVYGKDLIVLSKEKEYYNKLDSSTFNRTFFDVYNINTKKYVKEDSFGYTVANTSYYEIFKNYYYNISEVVETNTLNDKETYFDTNHYVVNLNSEKILDGQPVSILYEDSEKYMKNVENKEYLVVKNDDEKIGVVDTSGNVIIEFNYDKSVTTLTNETPIIPLQKDDNLIDIIDLRKGQVILNIDTSKYNTSSNFLVFHNNYLNVFGELYNYDGQLIYSEKQLSL